MPETKSSPLKRFILAALVAAFFTPAHAQEKCWTFNEVKAAMSQAQPVPQLHTDVTQVDGGYLLAYTGVHMPGRVYVIRFGEDGCFERIHGWMGEVQLHGLLGGA